MLILQTDRLRLRWFLLTDADADFMRALLNDPGWLANIGERHVRTRRQARTWITTRHLASYGRLGYAREAAAACVRYALDVLGLPEVWASRGPATRRRAHGARMEDRVAALDGRGSRRARPIIPR